MCSSARSPAPMHVAAAMFTPASLIAAATSASAPGVFSMSMTRSAANARPVSRPGHPEVYADPSTKVPLMRNDEEIRALLSRLSRRHPSGGTVIERAAIVADGADSAAVVAWILDHAGEPEAVADVSSKRGL